MATLGGMALGGWMSGVIFDLTGSYMAAFLNGLAWNLVNVSIVAWLLMRRGAGGRLRRGLTYACSANVRLVINLETRPEPPLRQSRSRVKSIE